MKVSNKERKDLTGQLSLRENAVHGTQGYPYASYAFDGQEDFQVPLHWHQEAEIIFVEKGNYQVSVQKERYTGEGPQLFFVGQEEIHSLELEKGTVETALVYAPQMLEFASYDSLQHLVLRPWMEGRLRFPSVLKPEDGLWPQAVRLYGEIWQSAQTRGISDYLRLKAGLYRLFACFCERDRMIRIGTDEEGSGNMDSLKRVLEFVRQNYGRRIRVEETAAVAGMNPQYFCRYFKKHTGRTVTEYINDVRISQASRLLAQTDDKILNIAVQCGYENAGYFISRFRRSKGVPPSEYRDQMKKSR